MKTASEMLERVAQEMDSTEPSNVEYREQELLSGIKSAVAAIEELLEDIPRLQGVVYGTTTLGNLRADLWGILKKNENYKGTGTYGF